MATEFNKPSSRDEYLEERYGASIEDIQDALNDSSLNEEEEVLDWEFMPGFNPSTASTDENWRGGREDLSLNDYITFEKSIKEVTPSRRSAMEDLERKEYEEDLQKYADHIRSGGVGVMVVEVTTKTTQAFTINGYADAYSKAYTD